MALRELREKLAGGPKPPEDAILLIAPDDVTLEQIPSLIQSITEASNRVSVVLAIKDRHNLKKLEELFPHALIRSSPFLFWPLIQLILTTWRIRAALVINSVQIKGEMRSLMTGAANRGVPVYELCLTEEPSISCIVKSLSSTIPEFNETLTTTELTSLLSDAIGVERDPRWSIDRLAGRFRQILTNSPLQRIIKPFFYKLKNTHALQQYLNHPRVIMCLGNGPTSTDPILETLTHDALFRVNHQWTTKNHMTQPDMVFVGVKRSMRKLRGILLGVANARKESALIACRAIEPWHGSTRYSVVEEIITDIDYQIDGTKRPTTGAYMIAAAIALQPDRLIIAGMDMFDHALGAYPGQTQEVNAYAPSHSRETDTSFIRACLATYTGELATCSPAFYELAKAQQKFSGFTLVELQSNKS